MGFGENKRVAQNGPVYHHATATAAVAMAAVAMRRA